MTRLVILLVIIPQLVRSQSLKPLNDRQFDCPPLRYSVEIDSLAQQASVDSIRIVLVGQWRLKEICTNSRQQPRETITMAITRAGSGQVYQNGRLRSSFQLTFERGLDRIRFTINEEGNPLFGVFRNHGFLLACEQYLEMVSGRSDETAYRFQRIR